MERKKTIKCIGRFLDMGKETGLTDELLEKAAPCLEQITKTLGVTPLQAALFAYIFDQTVFPQSGSLIPDNQTLYEALKCGKEKYLEYLNELDILEKRKLIYKRLDNDSLPVYLAPRPIIFALRRGLKVCPASYKNMSIQKFFFVLKNFFRQRAQDEMTFYELTHNLSSLLKDNRQLKTAQKISSLKLAETDKYLLMYFCNKTVNSDPGIFGAPPGIVTYDLLEKHFSDEEELFDVETAIMNPLRKSSHPLQKMKYIEEANEDGVASTESFVLSEKAKKDLLAELRQKRRADSEALTKASKIRTKTMFYNPGDEEKIEKLVKLLEPARFREVKKAMEKQGLRTGFACLFSGSPGTGKTETVYQIARRTRRDIFRVDISQVRSKWVGESEKNIKALFDTYRALAKGRRNAPILLFNEADAVIGRRSDCGGANKTVERMENTIQNIILEEMENLEGIMIATTNLAVNLDRAFERRFLYKIEFSKPDARTRSLLWQNMMDGLPDGASMELAQRFDLSGGQIENIVRKRQIDLVLEGREPSLTEIIGYCKDESMVKEKGFTVGFNAN
jgi:SpoVK/Ycf46/Vps4 family AAA+-type ATPase